MTTPESVQSLMEFLDKSPCASAAVSAIATILDAAGFAKLEERDNWRLRDGGSYYVIRNSASIVAFRIGSKPPANTGFRIVAAHTDSPSLRIKPGSESKSENARRVSVEVYGGPIYHTWLDRELSVAGLVTLRGDLSSAPEQRLFEGNEPIAIIPNPAIHLNRDVNKGFAYSPQDHLQAVLSAAVPPNNTAKGEAASAADGSKADDRILVRYLADRLEVEADSILGYDLNLCDRLPATIVGANRELLVSGRLDNLAMCHAAVEAIVGSSQRNFTQIVALFDSEEIGSRTAHGAAAGFFRDLLERFVIAQGGERDDLFRAFARSSMVSGDAAHGVHPNFPGKHDDHYKPVVNGGPVIKINAGQRYTTTAHTGALFEHICRERDVRCQKIISRGDSPTGSTVGPIVSSQLGIVSVDIGHPIWAMHSIRETGGVYDHSATISSLIGVFESEIEWR